MTRYRRRLVLAGLAGVLAAGGGVSWWFRRPSELDRVRAALDGSDPGWRFADIRAARLAEQPRSDENVIQTMTAAARLIPPQFKY
jgi:hypothetical protein